MTDPVKPQCDILVGEMSELMRQVNASVKAPRKYMDMAIRMVNKLSETELSAISTSLDALSALVNLPLDYINNPALDLAAMQNAINAMLSCAYVLGNPEMLAAITAAKVEFDLGHTLWSSMPNIFKRLIGKKVMQAAGNVLGAMNNQAIGKINAMQSNYNSLLKTSGIKSALNKANQLLSCAGGLCTNMTAFETQLDSHYTNLHLDAYGEPLDVYESSTKLSTAKKYGVKVAMDKMNSIKTSISAFESLGY